MGTSERCVEINTFPLLWDTRERVVFRGLWWYFIMSVSRVASEFRTTPATNAPRDHDAEDQSGSPDDLDKSVVLYLETHPEQLALYLDILFDNRSVVDIIRSVTEDIEFWAGVTLTRLCYRKLLSQHLVACRAAIDSTLYHTSAGLLLTERDTSEVVLKEVRRVFELELIAFLQGIGRFIHLVQAIRRPATAPTDPQIRRSVQQFLVCMDSSRTIARDAVDRLRRKSPQGGKLLKFLLRYEEQYK